MTKKQPKRLPLGISTFSEIIKNNYVYVDKTQHMYQMVSEGKYYFLSRPRRFGKSLLISTLDELLSGNKKLFEGLWIAQSDFTWETHPVIRFDFSSIGHRTTSDLQLGIQDTLASLARQHKVDLFGQQTITGQFQTLIIQLAQRNNVVILIDEYDKPILDHIDNVDEAKAQREVLKSLYSVIKGSDQYLRFVLLTGVTKFSKTSIFSGINNLRDITLSKHYATMLGYTNRELIINFTEHIELLAQSLKKNISDTVQQLRSTYDGYQFTDSSEKLFNPYSVLMSLTEHAFGDYWFETGTPTFLINLIKTGNYPLNHLYQPIMSASELGAFEPDNIKMSALLYQTGYLTIKEYNVSNKDYTLDAPNHEVASAFNLLISSAFTQLTNRQTKTFAAQIAQTFVQHDLKELTQVLQSLFNEMPYNVHIKREFDLQIIIFSIFKLIGIEVDPEVATSLGRADLVVSLPKLIYIIELKFNKSAHEALTQIQDKKYYEKYENSGKQITLLGINFESETKTVSLEWAGVEAQSPY